MPRNDARSKGLPAESTRTVRGAGPMSASGLACGSAAMSIKAKGQERTKGLSLIDARVQQSTEQPVQGLDDGADELERMTIRTFWIS